MRSIYSLPASNEWKMLGYVVCALLHRFLRGYTEFKVILYPKKGCDFVCHFAPREMMKGLMKGTVTIKQVFRRRIPPQQRWLHKWSPEAQRGFDAMAQKSDEWTLLSFPTGVGKSFLRSGGDAASGKKVIFQGYYNDHKKVLKMYAHFGEWTEGPIEHVHGGAISAMADTAMGVCIWYSGIPCVTANLTIQYRNKVPLNTTALLECKILNISGRKIDVDYIMTDLSTGLLYSEGHALFIQLNDDTIDPKKVTEYWQRTDW